MGDAFARDLSKIVVAQIAGTAGFHASQQAAFAVLADVLKKYIEEVGAAATGFANHACRTESNIEDVKKALEDINSPFMKLLLWNLDAEDVPPFAKPGLVSFPIQPIQGILFPEDQKDDEEEESVPPHIPEFLPPFPPKHTRLRKITKLPATPLEAETPSPMISSTAKPRVQRENQDLPASSITSPITSPSSEKPISTKGEKQRSATKRHVSDLYNEILMRGPKNQEEKEILDNPYFKPPVSAKTKRQMSGNENSPFGFGSAADNVNVSAVKKENGTETASNLSKAVDDDHLELIREGT